MGDHAPEPGCDQDRGWEIEYVLELDLALHRPVPARTEPPEVIWRGLLAEVRSHVALVETLKEALRQRVDADHQKSAEQRPVIAGGPDDDALNDCPICRGGSGPECGSHFG
jgi:hypothetical protein